MTQALRSGPLVRAQYMFWFYSDQYFMEAWGSEPRIQRRLRLPGGTSIASLQAALDGSAQRHEALRTVYERAGNGVPRQTVLAAHRPSIVAVPLDEVPPVGVFDEPSFRCQAIVDGSEVISAVLIANIIDLDGHSMALVAREVEGAVRHGGEPGTDLSSGGMQPIDLAMSELAADQESRERGQRAIRHFSELRRDTPRNFLPSVGWKFASDEIRSVTMSDQTLGQSAESIAADCRVSVPSVFYAAICKVVSDWTCTSRFMYTTAVANRWNAGLRGFVGRLAAAADGQFERSDDDTYRSLLKRVHRSLMRTYFFARCDTDAYAVEAAKVDQSAGSSLSRSVFIEYLDFLGNVENTWSADREPVSTVKPGRADNLWFNLSPFRNTVSLNVNADAAVLSEADAVEILRQAFDFVRRAAEDLDSPVRRLGAPGGRWGMRSDARWIELGDRRFSASRVEAAIGTRGAVSASAVFARDRDGLVAYIAGAEADLVEVHEHLLMEATHDPLIKVPSRYLLTAGAPSAVHRQDLWKTLPAVDRFEPSLDYPERALVDERFEVLKTAFAECIGPSDVAPTKSYVELGGTYLMIPAMMDRLRSRGYTGIDPGDFLGLGSMAALAHRLRTVE